jgi:hypothetical protein
MFMYASLCWLLCKVCWFISSYFFLHLGIHNNTHSFMCSVRYLCVCLCIYVFTSSLTDIFSYHFCVSLFLYLFVSVRLKMALYALKGAMVLIATFFIDASVEMGSH